MRMTTTAHGSDTRSVFLLFRRIASEVRRPDQPCVVAQMRGHDASLRAVSTAGQLPLERLTRRDQQQVTGRAHATTDDKHAGVEGRSQVGDADPQPVADLGEKLASRRVPIARGLRDQWAGQVAHHTFDAIEQIAGDGRVGREQLARLSHQRIAAGVLLPAPAVAALATVASRHDLHVSKLAGYAKATTLHLTVDQDAAANARTQGDHHDVGLTLCCPELPFGPDRRIGVVVDEDRHRDTSLQGILEGFMTPRQMWGKYNCRPVRRDKSGSADTNSSDGFWPYNLHQLSDDLDDRPFDNRWAL